MNFGAYHSELLKELEITGAIFCLVVILFYLVLQSNARKIPILIGASISGGFGIFELIHLGSCRMHNVQTLLEATGNQSTAQLISDTGCLVATLSWAAIFALILALPIAVRVYRHIYPASRVHALDEVPVTHNYGQLV